ncbi:nuclear transport factor 2 family protein [Nocardioides caldifontis]|uniref:nuclear transport factor 2 family protein n=1 Tax=Nocardioides caldifontis TaxID=2588938 RepID=UPI0011E03B6C|nr:nuclear transport factor 2 family protein [Nocardioides caldifontis]
MPAESRTLEERLRRLEDRREIDDLVLLYFLAMDERDLDALPRIFTEDAYLGSRDGVFDARGLSAVTAAYRGRFDVLGPTFHYSHGLVVRFDEQDPDRADGLLTAHAEVVRHDVTMWVALRYRDTYRRTPDGWRIVTRVMSYMYYVPASDYAEALRDSDRNLAYGEPREADWPSVLHGTRLDWLEAAEEGARR